MKKILIVLAVAMTGTVQASERTSFVNYTDCLAVKEEVAKTGAVLPRSTDLYDAYVTPNKQVVAFQCWNPQNAHMVVQTLDEFFAKRQQIRTANNHRASAISSEVSAILRQAGVK